MTGFWLALEVFFLLTTVVLFVYNLLLPLILKDEKVWRRKSFLITLLVLSLFTHSWLIVIALQNWFVQQPVFR